MKYDIEDYRNISRQDCNTSCKQKHKKLEHCPSHDAPSPSLSLSISSKGNVIFHCFAGCRYEDIRDAFARRLP